MTGNVFLFDRLLQLRQTNQEFGNHQSLFKQLAHSCESLHQYPWWMDSIASRNCPIIKLPNPILLLLQTIRLNLKESEGSMRVAVDARRSKGSIYRKLRNKCAMNWRSTVMDLNKFKAITSLKAFCTRTDSSRERWKKLASSELIFNASKHIMEIIFLPYSLTSNLLESINKWIY